MQDLKLSTGSFGHRVKMVFRDAMYEVRILLLLRGVPTKTVCHPPLIKVFLHHQQDNKRQLT